jgi:hypothetical protein
LKSTLTVLFSLVLFLSTSQAQLLINEFSASNSGNIVDPDYGNSADWIELFNAGDAPVNLNGYFITDNFGDRMKWQITGDHIIEPEGYLILWCDGMASGLHTNFKLAAEGEQLALSDAGGMLLDSLRYGAQESNISMGRVCDGCPDWVFFSEATPGSTNVGVNYKGLVQNEPYFFPSGGLFTTSVQVEIRNIFDGEIRYTTDGSEPSVDSYLYTGPVTLDTTTILRARIMKDTETKPGRIVTHSYFIASEQQIGSLPVVSLVSEPANFWDVSTGIYVQDFKPEWEIPVNIELFENDGSDRAAFNLPAGTKINGLYSWQLPQKMLGIYFRKRYGAGSLDYPLFFDKKATKYDSFALRASGNDWSKTLFRDAMLQNATRLTTRLDAQGYRPCVVYINGRYMGIHNIRSKVDADFIVNEQLDEGTKIDMIENENTIEEGSLTAYNQFKMVYSNDLSIASNYENVSGYMDIPLFMDYMATELYGGNSSIGHNVMTWKPVDYGKWKWIPVDLDRCMFDPDANLMSLFMGKTVYPFPALMKNSDFARDFGLKVADHLLTTFNPQRMSAFIDTYADRIRDELPRHIQRWAGTSSSYGNPIPSVDYWERSIAQMKTFAFQRPAVVLNDLKNYGTASTLPVSVGIRPASSAKVTINDLDIPLASITGEYPSNAGLRLNVSPVTGSRFVGWKLLSDTLLIPKGDSWKYYDKGAGLPGEWKNADYNDSDWLAGAAELGYGDGDETTRLSYGSSSSNKYITTYFRKKIQLNRVSQLDLFRISIKLDDGAVVYVNGREAGRINLPAGEISYSTLAAASVPNASIYQHLTVPSEFFTEGDNTLAVEIHQNAANSSDISFNLELRAGRIPAEFLSTSSAVEISISEARSVLAINEDQGWCMLPDTISNRVVLTADCSPYYSRGNVLITKTGRLEAAPGVEIRMADNSNIQVEGALQLRGSSLLPIRINAAGNAWGALVARNASDTLILENVVIKNAGRGPNPTTENAAISLFHTVAWFNNLDITDVQHNPILAKYSDVTLLNSQLHSKVTGDLINVKYGKAYIAHCVFRGNSMPDTDAIDYDDVTNGVIRNSLLHDFHGFNSDAIDIGEQARNISIDSIFIYNITDKGISVGQQSSVKITNTYFVNCNLGIAAKDSTHVWGDRLTFYGTNIPVAAYEKNIGSAGGNVLITRSILSNSNNKPFELDDKSRLKFEASYTDQGILPDSLANFTGDPLFESPNRLNFKLKTNSPLLANGEQLAGAAYRPGFGLPAMPVISALYTGDADVQDPEFIFIENPGDQTIDLSGYSFTEGIVAEIPTPTLLAPGERLTLTNMPGDLFWSDHSYRNLIGYASGRLNNSGEKLTFTAPSGIIVDQVNYRPEAPWPPYRSASAMAIRLKDLMLDNHFGYNWELVEKQKVIAGLNDFITGVRIYPNPATDYLIIDKNTTGPLQVRIYTLVGHCVWASELHESGSIDISRLATGVYLIQLGASTQRLIIRR